MTVTGDLKIVSTDSSIEENNSEIRLTGNANASILGDFTINSLGTTKGVEVELMSGEGNAPELSVGGNLNAFSNSAGLLKFDVRAQAVVSVAQDADFNIAGANTDFQLLVGGEGSNASFNTSGKLAVTTVSDIESKVRVRGSSEINVTGDLDLKMEKTATKLSLDLGEFGGASKLTVQGKFATLNTSPGELLTDIRGASTLEVDGDFELRGVEGTESTMTKVRVRSNAKATIQKNVRLLASALTTNIEFNLEDNAETTIKQNVEMEAMAVGRVKLALKSQSKLAVAKSFMRPTLYGSLEMASESELMFDGTECGQEVPAERLMTTGDKFELGSVKLANTSACGVALEATPYKRTSIKRIVLQMGLVNLNGQTLLVTDSDPDAIQREDGCFMGDGENDFTSKLIWDLGETGVKYTYPLCNESMEVVDVSITPNCEMGKTTVATYKTDTSNSPNNRPLPDGYTNFDYEGEEKASHFADRYYCIIPGNVHEGCAEIELGYSSEDVANNPNFVAEDIKVHNLSEFGLSDGRGEKSAGNKAQFTLEPGQQGRFVVGSLQTALPVQIAKFNVIKEGENSRLEWTTASEVNNDFFTIQRSTNGTEWIDIARADGAGTSAVAINYYAYDRSPALGENYYRLVQTDFNGAFSYSDVKSVYFDSAENRTVGIFPNLVSANTTFVNLDVAGFGTEEKLSYAIFSTMGELVQSSANIDATDVELHLNQIKSGLYYVKINSSQGYQKTLPIMVQ